MARKRLDPEHPKAVLFGTKLGQSDAERVIELANQAGVGRSEFVRSAVLGALEREDDQGPPDDGG